MKTISTDCFSLILIFFNETFAKGKPKSITFFSNDFLIFSISDPTYKSPFFVLTRYLISERSKVEILFSNFTSDIEVLLPSNIVYVILKLLPSSDNVPTELLTLALANPLSL